MRTGLWTGAKSYTSTWTPSTPRWSSATIPNCGGKPIAVGHAEERGVVAAASYEARKFGVRSAMSLQKAKRLCPQLVFIPGRMDVYKEVSRQIHEIFHEYTDIIERYRWMRLSWT